MVGIRIERGHAVFEVPQTQAGLGPISHSQFERGPVRLIVDAPQPRGSKQAFAIVAVLSVIVLAIASLARVYPCAALAALFLLVALWLWFRPLSRERVEICSRFVTVSRDEKWVSAFGRGQFSDPRINRCPSKILGSFRWGADVTPLIVFGHEGLAPGFDYLAGFGAGMTVGEATEVLARISEFCRENPLDPGVTFAGPLTVWLLDGSSV